MVTDIRINVKSICFGSEDIELIFGHTVIPFYASYMGPEPISTLLDSLIALEIELIENSDPCYHVSWADEPSYLKLDMWKKKESDILHLGIEYNNEGDGIYHKEEKWEFELSYQCYRKAIINESIRLLKQYGLDGFNRNWCDGNDTFPLNSLLILLGNVSKFDQEKEYSYSDIFSELSLLKAIFSNNVEAGAVTSNLSNK